MIESITNVVEAIINVLYQPYIVPLLLIVGGIYFTIRCKGLQVRLFGESFRVIMEKPHSEGGVSSFGALMVSTASRVGTGNIIGVATAIILGGPGAIFWMWITAILGGASAFVESTLAQIYKRKHVGTLEKEGLYYGGPSHYMERGLKQRWLGVFFAVLIIGTYALAYNMLAAYNLQSTFGAFSFYDESTTPIIIGVILAVIFGVIIIGGAKRLIKVTEFLVPIMGVIYIAISLVVLVMNAGNLGHMFGAIFSSAFDFGAIFGGFTGSCIMWGIKRGLYSNEAGMGSAPNAAAKADVSHPAKQGLVQMLSVFIDTLLICTATAFMCLSTNVELGIFNEDGAANAAGYVQACMGETLGDFGPIFLCIAMSLFAFTTLIGNYSYCEGCLSFILKHPATDTQLLVFRIISTVLIFLGCIASAGLVWDLGDLFQGFMVITNVPVILILGKKAFDCLDDYVAQRKAGKNPEFKAETIGVSEEDAPAWY
ncbi:MAG: alanine:cation symporter family protein [Clostridia bacterium]|nr:alanine:cation symporter family protein [Clostridia bacterium]